MRFNHLKRREFIALLGSAAAWPLARIQAPAKLPTIESWPRAQCRLTANRPPLS
jgi:hypothetical protein